MNKSEQSMSAQNKAKRNDVAALAGVSGTTVSFVFSKKRFVSPELKERVIAAAKKLDYHPDMVAASLKKQFTNTIAVITNDITSPLQMEVIRALQTSAIEKDFFVNICGGTVKLENYISHIISRRVDGAFLSVPSNVIGNEIIEKMLNRNISIIVTSSRGFCDDRVCGLELDFYKGLDIIVEHLKGLGHTKIAYISCFDDNYVCDNRLNAFRKSMKNLLGQDDPVIITGKEPYESNIEQGIILTNELIASGKNFTAVICTNDLMALGAMRAFNKSGLSVPEDVSVVGIDDIEYSKVAFPALTTLSHCSKEYGNKIFEILYANITDKSIVGREKITPQLIIRESTADCKNLK